MAPLSPHRPRRPRSARSGAAALEFALLGPVLLIMIAGIFDTGSLIINARRLQLAATAVATVASTAVLTNSSAAIQITDYQAFQATTAIYGFFPSWKASSAKSSYAVTLTAIEFAASPTNCTTNCTYTPYVAWSMTNLAGTAAYRACGQPAVVANGSSPSLTTIPTGVTTGSTPIFVADVSYAFKPFFSSMLIGTITMLRSAYIPPRLVPVANGNTTVTIAYQTSPSAPNVSGGQQQPDYEQPSCTVPTS